MPLPTFRPAPRHSSRPTRSLMAAAALAAGLAGVLTPLQAAPIAPVAVTVRNETTPTTCAEEDNVSLVLTGRRVSRFRVEALQPAYLPRVRQDTTAPDFSGCNFDGGEHPTDPRHRFEPRREVLHDGPRWQIVGMTLEVFWRPNQVPVEVDGKRYTGFHLLQVFDKRAPGGKTREAIVLYPADGYWRIKPLPLARFGDGVYGSSMLLGPVTQAGRPIVDIAAIRVRTQPFTIRTDFAAGGHARVRVAEVSQRRTRLDVQLSPSVDAPQPFAVLRSMYVSRDNADMADVRWLPIGRSGHRTTALPDVKELRTREVRFGRVQPSRHNTSAPDIAFSRFDSARVRGAD